MRVLLDGQIQVLGGKEVIKANQPVTTLKWGMGVQGLITGNMQAGRQGTRAQFCQELIPIYPSPRSKQVLRDMDGHRRAVSWTETPWNHANIHL